MATLHRLVLEGIRIGLDDSYQNWNLFGSFAIGDIVDRSYVRWEANGGVELQLPSFKLTNRQMLWLCIAHTLSKKYIRGFQKAYENELLNDFLNGFSGFKEAFQCKL